MEAWELCSTFWLGCFGEGRAVGLGKRTGMKTGGAIGGWRSQGPRG